MLKPGIATIVTLFKTSCCRAVLIIIFVSSLLLIPYELFFINAVIVLIILRFLMKNVRTSSTELSQE